MTRQLTTNKRNLRTVAGLTGRCLITALIVLAVASSSLAIDPPVADAAGEVAFVARIDDRDVSTGDNSSPIPLRPDEDLNIELDVANTGDSDLVLGYVRMQGSAVGIDFMTTDTTIRFPLAAGEQRVFQIPFEFFDLEDQATGLVRGTIVLFDEERGELGSVKFVADVRGSIFSGLGLFSAAVLAFAVISIAFNIYLASRRRLHKDRMIRGLQFSFSGLALGLLFGLALSILRIASTPPAGSFLAVIIPTLIAFGVGYLSPNRLSSWYLWEKEMIEQEWIDLEEEVRQAVLGPVDPNATIIAE